MTQSKKDYWSGLDAFVIRFEEVNYGLAKKVYTVIEEVFGTSFSSKDDYSIVFTGVQNNYGYALKKNESKSKWIVMYNPCGGTREIFAEDFLLLFGKADKPKEARPTITLRNKTSEERKAEPIHSGVLNYFPDALAAVARVSKAGNDKHNPGQPLNWSRGKSNDHMDCVARHIITPKEIDEDSNEYHLAHAAWRTLAALQLLEEAKLNELAIVPLSGIHPIADNRVRLSSTDCENIS